MPEDTGEIRTGTDTGVAVYVAPEPSWSAADVQAELGIHLGMGVPDPFTIYEAWQSMFVGADPGCPGGAEYGISSTASGCVSDMGWLYAGHSSYRVFDSEIEHSTVLSSDGYIISPDSGTMIGGGKVEMSVISEGETNAWRMEIEGTFGLDTSESPWLSQSPSMAMYFDGAAREGGRTATLLGGWSLDGRAVYINLAVDSSCADATGVVQVRDPSGAWHTLTLECGHCGPLHYAEGDPEEEICMDMAPIEAILDRMEATL